VLCYAVRTNVLLVRLFYGKVRLGYILRPHVLFVRLFYGKVHEVTVG